MTSKMDYSGSGIMVVEKYRGKFAIILFRNRFSKKYTDLGGYIDKKDYSKRDKLAITAAREAFEESCGLLLFNISKLGKNYVDYIGYRCYIVRIESGKVTRRSFIHNMKILHKSKNVPKDMKETDSMTRFYIDDLLRVGVIESRSKDLSLKDVYGKQQIIHRRARSVIVNSLKTGILQSALESKKVRLKKRQRKYLNKILTTFKHF